MTQEVRDGFHDISNQISIVEGLFRFLVRDLADIGLTDNQKINDRIDNLALTIGQIKKLTVLITKRDIRLLR